LTIEPDEEDGVIT